jgi:hypothetical protein
MEKFAGYAKTYIRQFFNIYVILRYKPGITFEIASYHEKKKDMLSMLSPCGEV